MFLLRSLAILFIASFLTACGNLQLVKKAQLPSAMIGKTIELSDLRPTKDEVMPRAFEIPNKSLFVQQTSGGSLAVGLLLGPLGGLANAANIDRITKEMGESGTSSSLFQIDAKQEAQLALNERIFRLPASQDPKKIKLKPFIVYFVADEKIGVDVLVYLRVETEVEHEGKPIQWAGNYSFYLDNTLPIDALKIPLPQEQLAHLMTNIRKSYDEIFGELLIDLNSGNLPKREIAWVKSRVLGIGMPGDIGKNKFGHLVLRAMWGNFGQNYKAVIFGDDKQYVFDNGPVAREAK